MALSRSRTILPLIALFIIVRGAATAPSGGDPPFEFIPDEHLHNVHRVTPKIVSGSQPDTEAAFKKLGDLGVKTIISVDGAKPHVDLAARYGMRYVHLPIGYDGVQAEQGKALAKAMHELPGPIYVHCHHGKHRSAAAVAVACVLNGSLPPSHAERVLQTFGTGENYKGLWQAARDARPLTLRALRAITVKYVPVAEIGPLTDAMVQIDHRWEHLKALQAAGWNAPEHHPDLDSAHEAMLLLELYRELARPGNASVKDEPEDFHRLMRENEVAAAALHHALTATPLDRESAQAALKSLAAGCKSCHQSHRD